MASIATASDPYAISCAGLFKTYVTGDGDEVEALKDININIKDGEFLSIVGPSGCGKSTLLKIFAGLESVSRGSALVRDRKAGEHLQDIGIVFQNATLLEWRTVLANTMLAADVHNLDPVPTARHARELLALVGLEGFANKYPAELSGGMQQRVAITRALCHKPSVLLMDEPFGALDALTREHMAQELQRIWLVQKLTVLFITHSISEAVFLSDRVVVMSARPGRVLDMVEIDLPRPRNLEVMSDPRFTAHVGHIRKLLEARALVD